MNLGPDTFSSTPRHVTDSDILNYCAAITSKEYTAHVSYQNGEHSRPGSSGESTILLNLTPARLTSYSRIIAVVPSWIWQVPDY
jgi:hypothetical protein